MLMLVLTACTAGIMSTVSFGLKLRNYILKKQRLINNKLINKARVSSQNNFCLLALIFKCTVAPVGVITLCSVMELNIQEYLLLQ